MKEAITRKQMYAYALGYYYGRAEGKDPDLYVGEDDCRHYYVEGYDAGVADYCAEDEEDK
jgi:hypothetical protein